MSVLKTVQEFVESQLSGPSFDLERFEKLLKVATREICNAERHVFDAEKCFNEGKEDFNRLKAERDQLRQIRNPTHQQRARIETLQNAKARAKQRYKQFAAKKNKNTSLPLNLISALEPLIHKSVPFFETLPTHDDIDAPPDAHSDITSRIRFKLIEFFIHTLDKLQLQTQGMLFNSSNSSHTSHTSHMQPNGSQRNNNIAGNAGDADTNMPDASGRVSNGFKRSTRGSYGSYGSRGSRHWSGASGAPGAPETCGTGPIPAAAWRRFERLVKDMIRHCKCGDILLRSLMKTIHSLLTSNTSIPPAQGDLRLIEMKRSHQQNVSKSILGLFFSLRSGPAARSQSSSNTANTGSTAHTEKTGHSANKVANGSIAHNGSISNNEKLGLETHLQSLKIAAKNDESDGVSADSVRCGWILYAVCGEFSNLFVPILMRDLLFAGSEMKPRSGANESVFCRLVAHPLSCLVLDALFVKLDTSVSVHVEQALRDAMRSLRAVAQDVELTDFASDAWQGLPPLEEMEDIEEGVVMNGKHRKHEKKELKRRVGKEQLYDVYKVFKRWEVILSILQRGRSDTSKMNKIWSYVLSNNKTGGIVKILFDGIGRGNIGLIEEVWLLLMQNVACLTKRKLKQEQMQSKANDIATTRGMGPNGGMNGMYGMNGIAADSTVSDESDESFEECEEGIVLRQNVNEMNAKWSGILFCMMAGNSDCVRRGLQWAAEREDAGERVQQWCEKFAGQVSKLVTKHEIGFSKCVARYKYGFVTRGPGYSMCQMVAGRNDTDFDRLMLTSKFDTLMRNAAFVAALHAKYNLKWVTRLLKSMIVLDETIITQVMLKMILECEDRRSFESKLESDFFDCKSVKVLKSETHSIMCQSLACILAHAQEEHSKQMQTSDSWHDVKQQSSRQNWKHKHSLPSQSLQKYSFILQNLLFFIQKFNVKFELSESLISLFCQFFDFSDCLQHESMLLLLDVLDETQGWEASLLFGKKGDEKYSLVHRLFSAMLEIIQLTTSHACNCNVNNLESSESKEDDANGDNSVTKVVMVRITDLLLKLALLNNDILCEVTELCLSHMLFPISSRLHKSILSAWNAVHANTSSHAIYLVTTHGNKFEQMYLQTIHTAQGSKHSKLSKLSKLSKSGKTSEQDANVNLKHSDIFKDVSHHTHKVKLISLQQGRVVVPNPSYLIPTAPELEPLQRSDASGIPPIKSFSNSSNSSNSFNASAAVPEVADGSGRLRLRPKTRVNPYAKALLKQLQMDEKKAWETKRLQNLAGKMRGHKLKTEANEFTPEMLEKYVQIRKTRHEIENQLMGRLTLGPSNYSKNNSMAEDEIDISASNGASEHLKQLHEAIQSCVFALWMRLVRASGDEAMQLQAINGVECGVCSINYLCEVLPNVELCPSSSKYKQVINNGNTLMFDNDVCIIFESFPVLMNVFLVLTQRYPYFSPLVAYVRSLLARCHGMSCKLEKKEALNCLKCLDSDEMEVDAEKNVVLEERNKLMEWMLPLFDICYHMGMISFNFYKIRTLLTDLSMKNVNGVIHVLCTNQVIVVRTSDVFNTPKKYLIPSGSSAKSKWWLLYDFNSNYSQEYGLKFGHFFKVKMNDKMSNDQTALLKQVLLPTKQLAKLDKYNHLIASMFANLQ